jgi:hypothetical protein
MSDSRDTGSGPGEEHEDQAITPPDQHEHDHDTRPADTDEDAPPDTDTDTDTDTNTGTGTDSDTDSDLGTDPGEPAWDDAPTDDGTTQDWRREAAAFALGALIGVVVVGLVWAGSASLSDDEPRAGAPTPSARPVAGSGSAAGSTRTGPADDPVERCATASARMESAVAAAVPAMDQWQVHVGAMNKLVVGEITLQQATEFWERTRVGAVRRLDSFAAADAVVRRGGVDCPVPGRIGRTASDEYRACARRVDAHARVLARARVATRTWRHHVRDMDMLRMGHLSPEDATRAWLRNWQQGVRQIEAYQGAVATARRTGSC